MTYTKVNSRWIKDLNISRDTIKVLQENIGRKILDIPCSNIFTGMSHRTRDTNERINKWDYFKNKKQKKKPKILRPDWCGSMD